LSDDARSGPGASPAGDTASREPSGEAPRSEALDAAVARLAEIAGSLQQLLDVQVARARVEVREKAFRALGWLLVSVLLLALTVIAGLYLLRGLSGLLTGVLWNAPWAGDLAAGAVGLLLTLAIGLLWRAGVRRGGLRRMREKFRGSAVSQPEDE
jgi:uncharacterized membrane protein YqjE